MEGLYLIHTREFISTNKEIYKIGRSSNIENRVRNYPNGSKILLAIINKNSIQCEKDLIKKFKLTFTQKQFYGNEYFEGNKYEMINMMCDYIITDNKECKRKEYIKKEKEDKKKERETEKDRRDKEETEKKKKENEEKEKEKEKKKKKMDKDKEEIDKEERDKEESKNIDANNRIILNNQENKKLESKKSNTKTVNKEYKCYKCFSVFKFISVFYKHLETSSRCSMSKNDINNYFTENNLYIKKYNVKQNNSEKINTEDLNIKKYKIKSLQCDKCKKNFSRIDSLNRHKKQLQCSKQKSNSIKQINTININPFEYEDINKIPSLECKDFLKSILEGKLDNFTTIISIIYSKLENKNFYKPKLSVYEIAIFHTNLTIKLYTYKDFINILFNHCILIIKKILFLYNTDFTINDIKLIINNLNTIINTKELYYKQIKLLIDTECINNNDTNKLNIKTITKNNKINTDDLTTYIKKCDEFNKDTETYINSILI